MLHTPFFSPLLNHTSTTTLSTFAVSDRVWKARVLVAGGGRGGVDDERVFEWTMVQRLGGHRDGFWYTESLIADGNDWRYIDVPGM